MEKSLTEYVQQTQVKQNPSESRTMTFKYESIGGKSLKWKTGEEAVWFAWWRSKLIVSGGRP